jgi:glycosyltransferase involved in cell wall biosynthesis
MRTYLGISLLLRVDCHPWNGAVAAFSTSAYIDAVADTADTLVFLPAWNEEENLPAVLDEVCRELPGADVLVVDDGSTDRTAEVAREHGAEVLSFGANRGLTAGIAAGYRYAAEHGYSFCVRVDADGQHPVEELVRLLARVRSDECDVAVGSRFASGDGFAPYRYRPSGPRRLGTALLRRSMNVALDRPFYDATSGMYAVNRKAMEVLAHPYTTEAPEVEALLRLDEAGLRVEEVPVDMRPRAGGESKLRGRKAFLVVLTVIATLLAAKRWRRR